MKCTRILLPALGQNSCPFSFPHLLLLFPPLPFVLSPARRSRAVAFPARLSGCSDEFSPYPFDNCVLQSKFNFTPIICIVTGAGRPGLIRQHSLDAAASRLGEEILRDSLGAACHTVRRVREVRQSKQPSAGPPSQTATASRMLEDKRLARFGSRANVVGKNRRGTSGCNDDSGYSTAAGLRGRGDGKSSAETECASGTGRAKGDPKSHGVESHDRGETGTFEQSQDTGTGCKGADRVSCRSEACEKGGRS